LNHKIYKYLTVSFVFVSVHRNKAWEPELNNSLETETGYTKKKKESKCRMLKRMLTRPMRRHKSDDCSKHIPALNGIKFLLVASETRRQVDAKAQLFLDNINYTCTLTLFNIIMSINTILFIQPVGKCLSWGRSGFIVE
jgi:hypothetical protein